MPEQLAGRNATIYFAQTEGNLMNTRWLEQLNRTARLVGLSVIACALANAQQKVTLPIEVMGQDGTVASVQVNVPSLAGAPAAIPLQMRINGLEYETQASVQVNNSGWIPITSAAMTAGLQQNYGGIGGGFSTLKFAIVLPAGTVVQGNNTVAFRFNGTDGSSSGFRVLNFNFLGAGGKILIPSTTFVQDNPAQWKPPLNDATDIAAGYKLWQTASLTTPVVGSSTQPILAHCMDCHSEDGRDLKYFNYSNSAIETRAAFHGLNATQGMQIASYIRSLNLPSPGRPWNPPYQPGPGLDAKPVSQWSAGAGIGAVLNSDAAMLPYLTPGGSTAGWAASSVLDARTTPIALQLPSWNMWLPKIHPMDAFGATFINSTYNSMYSVVRGSLVANSPASYTQATGNLVNWLIAQEDFLVPIESSNPPPNWDAGNLRNKVYSAAQWSMVKQWEINQEFGLEAMPQAAYGSKAESRAWYGNRPFFTSPNMLHITPEAVSAMVRSWRNNTCH